MLWDIELSGTQCQEVWPFVKENNDLRSFFPNFKPSQMPEKEFIYVVLCTVNLEEVRVLFTSYFKQRDPTSQDGYSELVKVMKRLKEAFLVLYSIKSKFITN